MYNWIVISGLITFGVLILIPVVMASRLAGGIVSAIVSHRGVEARKKTCSLPELGDFSTTDDKLWFGDVQGLQITFVSHGQPPTEGQAKQARAILGDVPQLLARARTYLSTNTQTDWVQNSAGAFEPFGIEPMNADSFLLHLSHPADPDGMYWIKFDHDQPIESGRDD